MHSGLCKVVCFWMCLFLCACGGLVASDCLMCCVVMGVMCCVVSICTVSVSCFVGTLACV